MKMYTDATFAEHAANGMTMRTSADRLPQPEIVANHIDGPLLYFSDGQLHWLNPWQRFQYWMGWTDEHRLQRKLRPRLSAELADTYWANRGSQ